MADNKNNVGLQEMFDYLRDDVKQFREETKQALGELRTEQRRFTDALLSHTKEDHDNFATLSERLSRIEVSDNAVNKSKEARFSRFVGYGGMFIAAVASITAVVALLK